MKFARLSLCALAAVALIAGCGKSTDPTRVTTEDNPTPSLDNSPPPVPSGLRVTEDLTGHASLTWTPSTAPDLAGYEIHVYDPDPDRESAYALLHSTDATTVSYSLDPSDGFVTRYFRVRSVDASGNRSAMSGTLSVTTGPVQTVGGDPEDPPLPTMDP